MGKVLVTGGSGFIGGHLIEALLRRGADVRCLVRRTSQLVDIDTDRVELTYGDVVDADSVREAVRGVETVYHVAGLTRTFRKQAYWDVNERGTSNVAQACAEQANPPVHIYVSSIAASGPASRNEFKNEADKPQPVSNYGRSKLAGEEAAARFAHQVPTTIIRPGIVFGPRNTECFPVFQTIQRTGIHPVPGFRKPPLSYIHIDDLVQLMFNAAARGGRIATNSSESGQGIYFATVEEHPTYADFGRMISRSIRRSDPFVIPIAMPTLYVCATINECIGRIRKRTDPFNIDKMREANVWSWACDAARARRDLNFRPSATLEQHIEAAVEWYRSAGWLPEPRVRQPVKSPSYAGRQ